MGENTFFRDKNKITGQIREMKQDIVNFCLQKGLHILVNKFSNSCKEASAGHWHLEAE